MRQIVIISGKGGTGKTSLSAALATMGEQLTVADCDVDAANLHLLLQPDDHSRHPFSTGAKVVIDQQLCTQCGACMDGIVGKALLIIRSTSAGFSALSIISG
jgi:MinD superfamily P-loop ATPase